MDNNCLGISTNTSVVFEGDSITAGVLVTFDETFPTKLSRNTLSKWNVRNAAVSGSTTTTISDAARLAANTGFISNSAMAVLVLWIGTNDLSLTTDSAATVMSRIVSYVNARKAEGFSKVLMITTMPIDATAAALVGLPGTATHEARRLQLNTLIRQQKGVLFNDVVDVGAHPLLGEVANTTNAALFPDGIHLSNQAYDIVASLVKPSITSV